MSSGNSSVLLKKPPLTPAGMTGVGQRMPSQQAIILRPGQQTGIVTLPGGQQVRQQVNTRPVLVNAAVSSAGGHHIRVSAPGIQTRPPLAGGRNVVINQSGSQISVPLHALQSMQAGQGIPTGQAGHLLVKTETGQYQIVKVGPSAGTPTASTATSIVSTVNSQHRVVAVPRVSAPTVVTPSRVPVSMAQSPNPVRMAPPTPTPPPSAPSGAPTPPTAASVAASKGAGGGGMGGNQMTPDTAKHKCKNFLATLQRLAEEQPPAVAENVRNLIQGLIDGVVDPETFTTKLQRELNSSPQPCLVPFLKRSLPFLQNSLLTGELSIDGVRPPPRTRTMAMTTIGGSGGIVRNVTTVVRPPTVALPTRPVASVMRSMGPNPLIRTQTITNNSVLPNRMLGMQPQPQTTQNHQMTKPAFMTSSGITPTSLPRVGALNMAAPNQNSTSAASTIASMTSGKPSLPVASISTISAQQQQHQLLLQQQNPIKMEKPVKSAGSNNSYSVTGDEDINDVAAMGGVNLAEESQRMAIGVAGTQIRSCKDETFLQTGLLHKRISKICLENGLDEPTTDLIALVSHATQDRLKTLLEKLSVISEHRLDIVKQEGDYEVTQDVRGQLRFLGELDKIERRRHEEAERELLLRAAKSRTKTEDPEKEKLKAKAKELQRLEEEQVRHEKANNTALLAIGGPRKKMKLDDNMSSAIGSALGSVSGGSGSGLGSGSGSAVDPGGRNSGGFVSRPRMKRVHIRDLLFLMENDKDLKRSPLLWKAHCS